MRYRLLIVAALGMLVIGGGVAIAAPDFIKQPSILPQADNTYELGTSTARWFRIAGSYASTTAVSATTLCFSSDCRSSWGSIGSTFPFTPTTNFGRTVNATSTPIWFQAGIYASSTATSTFSGPFQAPIIDWGGTVFDVRAYGAKFDGVTDDKAAVQAAITAADALPVSGAVILLPAGTAKLSGAITMCAGCTLRGQGKQATKLQTTATSGALPDGAMILTGASTDYVTIEGMEILGHGEGETSGTGISMPTGVHSFIVIRDVYVHGFPDHGIHLVDPILCSIEDSWLRDNGQDGLFIDVGTTCKVKTVYASGNNRSGIHLKTHTSATIDNTAAEYNTLPYWLESSANITLNSPYVEVTMRADGGTLGLAAAYRIQSSQNIVINSGYSNSFAYLNGVPGYHVYVTGSSRITLNNFRGRALASAEGGLGQVPTNTILTDSTSSVHLNNVIFTDQLGTATSTNGISGPIKSNLTTSGEFGLGTSTPYAPLSVVGAGGVVAESYSATSTTATSTFTGAVHIGNATAGSNALEVDCTRTFPASISVGGCVNINNGTTNGAAALTLNSQFGAGATARVFTVQATDTDFDQELATLQSASLTRTTLGIIGSSTSQGTIKATHNGFGTDGDVAVLSLDCDGDGTACQHIFIDSTTPDGLGTTGNALTVRKGGDGVDRLVIKPTGWLGIGTSTPGMPLSVAGNILGHNIIGSYFTATTTLTASVFPYASTTAISTSGNAYVGGNLGIGTSSPSFPLEVNGTSYFTNTMTQKSATNAQINQDRNATTNTALNVFRTTGVDQWAVGLRNDATVTATNNIFHIRDVLNGVTAIAAIQGTNPLVGIGTSTPQWKLNPFSSTASQLALSSGAGFSQWAFRNAGGNFYLSTTTVAGTATTSTPALSILGATNFIGIGSSTPGSLLSLGDTGANTINLSHLATSTFGSGLNIRTGCYAINGVCVGGGSGSSVSDFTFATNYGAVNAATSSQVWFQDAIHASSTVDIGTSRFSTHAAGFTDLRRTGADFTLFRTLAPLNSPREATNAIVVDCDNPAAGVNEVFMDRYAENYSDSYQSGLRLVNTGTCRPQPFVLGHWLGGSGGGLSKDSGNRLIMFPSGTVAMALATSTVDLTSQVFIASSTATNLLKLDAAPGTNRVTVLGTGLVGIGTTTPSRLLQINTAGSGVQDVLGITSSIGQASAEPRLVLGTTAGGASATVRSFGGISAVGGTSFTSSLLKFWVDNGSGTLTNYAVLDKGGNFGVGTTTPVFSITAASTTAPQLALSSGAGFAQWTMRNAGGHLYLATTTVAGTATTTSPAAITVMSTGAILMPNIARTTAGTNSDTCLIAATGEVIADTTGTCIVSSKRFKHDIKTLDLNALDLVRALRPVTFSPNENDSADYKDTNIGLIAEEVADIDPRLVRYGTDGKPRTLDSFALATLAFDAIQELEKKVGGVQVGKLVRSVEENWQWGAIGLLFLFLLWQQRQIRRLKK